MNKMGNTSKLQHFEQRETQTSRHCFGKKLQICMQHAFVQLSETYTWHITLHTHQNDKWNDENKTWQICMENWRTRNKSLVFPWSTRNKSSQLHMNSEPNRSRATCLSVALYFCQLWWLRLLKPTSAAPAKMFTTSTRYVHRMGV